MGEKFLSALYGMGDGNITESDAMFTARFLVRRIRRGERIVNRHDRKSSKAF